MKKMGVLFLCTGNSIRSQMAEGFLRSLSGDRFEVWSAGVAPFGIHPLTIQVMKEEGIDLSVQRSKSVEEIPIDQIDYFVTVCGYARDVCPTFPKKIPSEHWPIEDPISFQGNESQRLARFRKTRDDVRNRVRDLIQRLG